jgi:hypothetical protein
MTEDEFVPLRGLLPPHLVLLLKSYSQRAAPLVTKLRWRCARRKSPFTNFFSCAADTATFDGRGAISLAVLRTRLCTHFGTERVQISPTLTPDDVS